MLQLASLDGQSSKNEIDSNGKIEAELKSKKMELAKQLEELQRLVKYKP